MPSKYILASNAINSMVASDDEPRSEPKAGRPIKPRCQNKREELTPVKLEILLKDALASGHTISLVVAYLVNKYRFDIRVLLQTIEEQGLDVCFSKVTFAYIAPLVGLDPLGSLCDINTFDITRARIPTSWFKEIIGDMHLGINQYGPPEIHKNEEARSRFLAPLLGRIHSEFKFLIWNTPDSIMPGRMATKGWIEYQFRVCGALTILFIEVKLSIGSQDERMNAVAQVIAEADACDLLNFNSGFRPPIHVVLCDGLSFEFFCFDGSIRPPTISRGVTCLEDGTMAPKITLPSYETSTRRQYIKGLRPVCESFFAMFLHGYIVGLQAYCDRSLMQAKEHGKDRESTPPWVASLGFARDALDKALSATELATGGDLIAADTLAVAARDALQNSLSTAPPTYRRDSCNLMAGWDDEDCR